MKDLGLLKRASYVLGKLNFLVDHPNDVVSCKYDINEVFKETGVTVKGKTIKQIHADLELAIKNIIDNQGVAYESARLYYDFRRYVDNNLVKDIREVKRMGLDYLPSALKETKVDVRKEFADLDFDIFDEIDRKDMELLGRYLSTTKSSLDRINRAEDTTRHSIRLSYDYYQAKLDWYAVTPSRVVDFIEALGK